MTYTPIGTTIDDLRKELPNVPAADLPALIGQLEELKMQAYARLLIPQQAEQKHDAPERLLTVIEVAERLGQTAQSARSHKHELPRVALTGSRSLRFSEKRITTMIKRRVME